MKSLLSESFAPITSRIGFVEASLEESVLAMEAWLYGIRTRVSASRSAAGLIPALRSLEPLVVGGRPRQLLIEAGGWTAYFDSLATGTDPVSAIGHLSRSMKVQGLAITAIPHLQETESGAIRRYGAVQWELFGPLPTDFLNTVRSVSLTLNESRGWFSATGTEQPFEEISAYGARRIRDRFTSDMLDRYCRALGVDVFNPDFYGPRSVLFDSNAELGPNPQFLSLEQAQARLGIVPGVVGNIQG